MSERTWNHYGDEKVFILYDGRAKFGDTEDAAVLVTAPSEQEAWNDSRTNFKDVDAVWFEYDLVPASNKYGREATNEKMRPDIGKGLLL
jgi:hypothetical protein